MIVLEFIYISLVITFKHEIALPDEWMILKQEPDMKNLNTESR